MDYCSADGTIMSPLVGMRHVSPIPGSCFSNDDCEAGLVSGWSGRASWFEVQTDAQSLCQQWLCEQASACSAPFPFPDSNCDNSL